MSLRDWLEKWFRPRPKPPRPEPPAPPFPADLDALAARLLELVNRERDLFPLTVNLDLRGAARWHAIWMGEHQQLTHDEPGLPFPARLAKFGWSGSSAAENVAAGQETPAAVVQTWLASPHHRANMLGREYSQAGVGVGRAADGLLYWCLVVGV